MLRRQAGEMWRSALQKSLGGSSTSDEPPQKLVLVSGSEKDDAVISNFKQRYHWTEGDCIGQGSNGAVFRIISTPAGSTGSCAPYALKVMKKDPGGESEGNAALHTEFKLHDEVSGHSNIVRLVEWIELASMIFCVLEMAPMSLLQLIVRRNGRFTEKHVAGIVRDVAGGLAACHAAGFAHFDLKPDNVLLGANGRIMLSDFGLAELVPAARTVNCPFFIAPEIVRCGEIWEEQGRDVAMVSTPADVWALGVLTYILLCGYPPFTGSYRHLTDSVLRVAYHFHLPHWEAITDDAKCFVEALLRRNPAERLTALEVGDNDWIASNAYKKRPSRRKKGEAHRSFRPAESLRRDEDGAIATPVAKARSPHADGVLRVRMETPEGPSIVQRGPLAVFAEHDSPCSSLAALSPVAADDEEGFGSSDGDSHGELAADVDARGCREDADDDAASARVDAAAPSSPSSSASARGGAVAAATPSTADAPYSPPASGRGMRRVTSVAGFAGQAFAEDLLTKLPSSREGSPMKREASYGSELSAHGFGVGSHDPERIRPQTLSFPPEELDAAVSSSAFGFDIPATPRAFSPENRCVVRMLAYTTDYPDPVQTFNNHPPCNFLDRTARGADSDAPAPSYEELWAAADAVDDLWARARARTRSMSINVRDANALFQDLSFQDGGIEISGSHPRRAAVSDLDENFGDEVEGSGVGSFGAFGV